MNKETVKRQAFGIGWISGMNFVLVNSFNPIDLKHYNGRLCFQIEKTRIGLKKWKKNSTACNIMITNDCPF